MASSEASSSWRQILFTRNLPSNQNLSFPLTVYLHTRYIGNTAVLQTMLYSQKGDVLQIKDFAPRFAHYDRLFRPFQWFRTITAVKGDPRIRLSIRPTFQYNASEGYQTRGSHHLRYCGPHGATWRLTTNYSIQSIAEETSFLVNEPMYVEENFIQQNYGEQPRLNYFHRPTFVCECVTGSFRRG